MSQDYVAIEGINSEGYGTISKKVMRDKSLPINSKAIYSYLCSFTGPGMTAWPGRKTACEDLGINKDTWTKYIRPLKERDYLRITKRPGEKGHFASNLYTIVTVPCPKPPDTVSPDTVRSDTINNRSFDHDHNNDDIDKKLSTRRKAFEEYSKEISNGKQGNPGISKKPTI